MFFNVEAAFDIKQRSEISAELEYVSQRAGFYVEKGIWQGVFLENLAELGNDFDNLIVPEILSAYGSDWVPGRIKVVISDMVTSFGYIDRRDTEDIIYLSAEHLGNDLLKDTLAHEFQHLVTIYNKEDRLDREEKPWLLEALAEYAPVVVGYNNMTEKRKDDFFKDPSNSLVGWSNALYDHAPVNLFMNYAVEQKGIDFLKSIIASNKTGVNAFPDFIDLYVDWTIANFVNDCEVDVRYCYQNEVLNHKVPPTVNYNLFPIESLSVGASAEAYSPHWYKISGLTDEDRIIKIEFKGNDDEVDYYVPYVITDKKNKKTIGELKSEIFIESFGKDINSVTIIPSSNKKAGFSFTVSVVDEIPDGFDNEELRQKLIERIEELEIIVLTLRKQILERQVELLRARIKEFFGL